MANIKNKRLHISATEFVTAFVFIGVLIIGAFFYSQYIDVKKYYNIKDTSVDFIIPAPSKEQINEINGLTHVNTVVPYVFRTIESSSKGKTI